MLLGEPVHDRVAAVGQHDEQHAAAVVRRAPQRLDPVERRAVADDRDDRAARARPSARRSRPAGANPSPPIAALRKPERGPGRAAAGAGRGGSTASPRRRRCRPASRSASAAMTCAARSGSPSAGRRAAAPAGARRRRASPDRAGSRSARAAHTGGGPGDHRELHRAVVGVLDVVGDQRDRRAGVDERALLVGVLAEHRRADREHDVVAGQRLAQPGPAGGQVAGEQRVVLREAGAGGERLLPHRRRQPLGQRDQRGPGRRVVRVGADHQRGRARPRQQVGQLVERRGVRRGARGAARRARRSRRRRRARPSRRWARSPARARAPSFASCQARATAPGTSWARAGWLHPHRVLAGQPGQVPGEERPVERGGGGPAGRRSPPAGRGWSAPSPARPPRCPARRWCAG